jgi:acyl carrier protein
MTDEQIYSGLAEVIRDVFDDDSIVIGPDTTAQDVPGWDSQAHVMLIVAAELHFGVRFKTAEFEALHNVGEFVSLIGAKLGDVG